MSEIRECQPDATGMVNASIFPVSRSGSTNCQTQGFTRSLDACPLCDGKETIWRGWAGGDWDACECVRDKFDGRGLA